ncbi:transcription factor Opi1-domain-containing protein [Poronia punctata]|nr:transcription factor Opi1-domain-containing protein [Poronia punctata]
MDQSTDDRMALPLPRPVENFGHLSTPAPTQPLDRKPDLFSPPVELRKHGLPGSDPDVGIFDRFDRPFKPPHYPPPSYTQTRDTVFNFSHPQSAELAPIKCRQETDDDAVAHGNHGGGTERGNHSLPSLSSITSSASISPSPLTPHHGSSSAPQRPPEAPPPVSHWPSLNPLTAYYTPSHVQDPEPPLRMDVDSPNNNNGRSGASPNSASSDQFHNGRSSSVSLDDPDVRMAAEALGDLRADFVSSPRHKQSPPRSPRGLNRRQPEPLLSLLTTSHPLLATTIGSATSAYASSKNISPRIKTSIEYVECCVLPLANTVGSVGRAAGVENGVRWFLRRRQRPGGDLGSDGQGASKRRKFGPTDSSYESGTPESSSGGLTPRGSLDSRDRQLSVSSTADTLPAYDDFRSPPYVEQANSPEDHPAGAAWHRLVMSTSGLGVAMSDDSLRRLKYCLGWIRWANAHIGNVVNSLTVTMEKYEQSDRSASDAQAHDNGRGQEAEDRNQLAAKIGALRVDVVKTLRDVTETVSQYAGGALPENARALVRSHLKSLPQRLHLANMANNNRETAGRSDVGMREGQDEQEHEADKKTRESAQLVLVIAKEGLEMMSQVSGVLNGTIESAEEWCERLGKDNQDKSDDMADVSTLPQVPFNDTKMSG